MANRFDGGQMAVIVVGLAVVLSILAYLSRDSIGRASALPAETFNSFHSFNRGMIRRARAESGQLNPLGQNVLCSGGGCSGDVNVPGKLFFGDESMDKDPCPVVNNVRRCDLSKNNTDPYHMEKVVDANHNSSLRITINDDPDENLEVWGDSCRHNGCYGPGAAQHRLRADGAAAHRGSLSVNADNDARTPKDMWGFNYGIHSHNPHMGWWSHLPWMDGVNYLRGNVSVKGTVLAENHDPGPMIEKQYPRVAEGDRYGVGQFTDGRMRMYGASKDTYDRSSVGLSFARPGGEMKDVVVATNLADVPNVRVYADSMTVGKFADPNLGVQVFSNGRDGADRNSGTYQGGLESWYGIGFRSKYTGLTRFMHDTRSGETTIDGRLNLGGQLCLGSTCISEADLKNAIAQPTASMGMNIGLKFRAVAGYFHDDIDYFRTKRNTLAYGTSSDGTNLGTFTMYNFAPNSVRKHFTIMWVGRVLAKEGSGIYTFTLAGDDAAYLWLANNADADVYSRHNALIDIGGLHPVVTRSQQVSLIANRMYDIRIMYGQNEGAYDMRFSIKGPSGVTSSGQGYLFS